MAYTSELIYSVEAFYDYKRFEVKCKIPKGRNMWPSFWTFGWASEINLDFSIDITNLNSGLYRIIVAEPSFNGIWAGNFVKK